MSVIEQVQEVYVVFQEDFETEVWSVIAESSVVNVFNSGGGANYVHTQATPSALWTINHNLGYLPDVTLFMVGGVRFNADITVTNTQAFVTLTLPLAGTARCE